MFDRVVLRALIAVMAISASVPLAADPICLGQAVVEIEGEMSVIEDPEWKGHGWAYTTIEGAKVNACHICLGDWESVPCWVAGLERICPQVGRDNDDEKICEPVYDWDTCQEQILRCPTVIGC